jgi:hypothetical protein
MKARNLFETLAVSTKLHGVTYQKKETGTLCCCLNTKLFSMLRRSAMVTLEYMLLWNVMEVGCQLHVQKPLPPEYGFLYPLNMDGTTA